MWRARAVPADDGCDRDNDPGPASAAQWRFRSAKRGLETQRAAVSQAPELLDLALVVN